VLAQVDGIARIDFTEKDVVRHPLVAEIVAAYDRHTHRPPGGGS